MQQGAKRRSFQRANKKKNNTKGFSVYKTFISEVFKNQLGYGMFIEAEQKINVFIY